MLVGAALAAIVLVFFRKKKSRLKPLLLASLLLILSTSSISADYQAGLNAYAVSDYHQAMQEWRAVTEQPPGEVNPAIYAETHYAIARLYWQGQGVPRDYYQAHDWLIKAAALNHAGAMAKLGFLYTDGITVQQDFNKAFEWYSKAAKLGDVDGLYNLGIFHLNGWGTDPDPTMAKQYLAAASAQGDPEAEKAFQQLMADDLVGAASAAIELNEDPLVEAPSPAIEESDPLVGAASAAINPEEDTDTSIAVFSTAIDPEPVGAAKAAIELNEDPLVGTASPAIEESDPLVGAASAAIEVADQTQATPEKQSRLKPLLQGESWILERDPTHYTIQAIGLTDRQKLEDLIKGHENLAPYAIYTVQKTTRPIHVLIQGVYPTVEEARVTRDSFPRSINRPSEVWIRQFGKIQAIMEAEK